MTGPARFTRRGFLTAGAALTTLPLTGCFGLTTTPPPTFDLSSGNPGAVQRRSASTVVITRPKTIDTYATERIVVRQPGGVLSYLPDAQLADVMPELVQIRMIQTFENANFPNIGRPDDQLAVDVTLATEVRAFEIDVTQGPVASVRLGAKLVNERIGEIFANHVFSAQVPTTTEPSAQAVADLDRALQDVIQQILTWTARTA